MHDKFPASQPCENDSFQERRLIFASPSIFAIPRPPLIKALRLNKLIRGVQHGNGTVRVIMLLGERGAGGVVRTLYRGLAARL